MNRKIVCKKYCHSYNHNPFLKGRVYNITGIYYEESHNMFYYIINQGVRTEVFSQDEFTEFFEVLSEVRKKKLEKIHEQSR